MLHLKRALLPLLLLGGPLAAQTPGGAPASSSVRGVAFDSLRGRPLAGAFVTLDDGGRNTSTDANGRFAFDSVAPGQHSVAMQHAALDSVGLFGVAARFVVGAAPADVRVATPSFATLWRDVCGRAAPAADTGFVFGAVTDAARGRPVTGATIRVSWMRLDERAVHNGDFDHLDVAPMQWVGAGRSGPSGTFGVCGVPAGVAVRVFAATDSAASGVIDLPAGSSRVRRIDLRVAQAIDSVTVPRGAVAGVVTDTAGRPLPNVRLAVADAGDADARSGDDGRFTLRDIPAGTRQVEAFAIGMSPATAVVDVTPGETASIALRLRKVTTLDVVNVVASPARRRVIREFEERRRTGLGYFRDSTALLGGSLAAALGVIPSIDVVRARGTASSRFTILGRSSIGRCQAFVYIDGKRDLVEQIDFLRPSDLAAIEVYPRATMVPAEFTDAKGACGVVALWTKEAFAYRYSGNTP